MGRLQQCVIILGFREGDCPWYGHIWLKGDVKLQSTNQPTNREGDNNVRLNCPGCPGAVLSETVPAVLLSTAPGASRLTRQVLVRPFPAHRTL